MLSAELCLWNVEMFAERGDDAEAAWWLAKAEIMGFGDAALREQIEAMRQRLLRAEQDSDEDEGASS